jgi:CelD/BcsL family acetyltransferase involved in cellulose biosynthesis
VNELHCIQLDSVAELRAATATWDDLWRRSSAALPTLRAETLAQWIEQFRLQGGFRAIVVTQGDRWLAALPLVACRVGWALSAGGLPTNPWAAAGDLLLDETANVASALDCLLAGARKLPWQLLWLNDAVPEAPRWRAFLAVCDRAGIAASTHERFRVGRVEIDGDWESYQRRLPKNHRQQMARCLRRLADQGDVRFEMRSNLDPVEVEPWLREAFELEDRGWKGEAGTSALRSPGMFDFFIRQSRQLAEWGQLEAASLQLNGNLVAFVHGFRSGGVYFAHKIGYNPQLAGFSPGQLLFNHILEQLHSDGATRALDFLGPLNQSLSRWRPATYGVGRIVLATGGLPGRAAMYAYQHVWRRLRGRESLDVAAGT